MKKPILITGSSGLVGKAITDQLDKQSLPWTAVHRSKERWDPEKGIFDPVLLDGHSIVIHLAGEPIAAGRWTDSQKKKIYESRVKGTRAVADAIANSQNKPELMICASAIGFYGDRGEEVLHESSAPGEGFLPEVVKDWEAAVEPARVTGVRVVHLRLGIVLSPEGGALNKMLPPFKLGLGGKLGSGRMWMSWVHIDDVVQAFLYVVSHQELKGRFNLTAPSPARNTEFTKILGAALSKPTIFPAPAFVIKLLLGEMGETLLLQSTRVLPTGLLAKGFRFRHPDLDAAMADLLN